MGPGGRLKVDKINISFSSTPVLLKANATSPLWSPDGNKIAYAVVLDLHVINIDGSGDQLLFSAFVSQTLLGKMRVSKKWILLSFFSVNLHSTSPPAWRSAGRSVTLGETNYYTEVHRAETENHRAFETSSSGNEIAFMSRGNLTYGIYKINADGSGMVKLTGDDISPNDFDWSPDSKNFAYYDVMDGIKVIYIVAVNTK